MTEETIGVIGGGILGVAVARELTLRRPGTRVVVLEKEHRVGVHQTGHNSGVVHAGIYYPPGSLKAELCTRGRALLKEYAAHHDLPYDECGKLVVAVDDAELGGLDELERRGRANGVPRLRRVDAAAIAELEPHTRGVAALHSPATAITDFTAVTRRMAEEVTAAGGEVRTGSPVTAVRHRAGRIELRVRDEVLRFDRLVVCAGLWSDRVSRLADGIVEPRIIPFRGEYLTVRPERRDLVRGLVYPVPDPRYPFLGVHFTRRVDGALEIGPNAVLALRREDYGRPRIRPRDVAATLGWPGFWRMAGTHWRTGLEELRGSLSIDAYLADARRYVPELTRSDVVRGRVGVRAQAVDRDGSLVDDFRITHADGITCIRNAPSPAATSSLAIAAYVVDRMAG